ncbi:Gfo/Idh/MocA family oxidoreductase (plasmid) [Pseudalkalibacillus hwajinpoensis]|uniref:Gfo/Idh/MocA family protein n=1 Tax=Guptibacillus hwajinpoensis TaxID=208199 RepID=UPI00325C1117
MNKKKVAIIGGGQVAEKNHLPSYREREDVEVVAVLNQSESNARAFAKRHTIPQSYTDLKELLTVEKPDIVSVCTPNKYHYQHVMEALYSGSHVFCEKPPSIAAAEAKEMNELARSRDLVLGYNFQHRFSEETVILRNKVREGVLGEIYHTKASALRRSGVPGWGNFINKDLQGGGPLIDLGIHMLDSAFFIMDFPEVKKVTAKMFQKIGPYKSEGSFGKWNPEEYEVEDSLFGFIELTNGGLIQIDTSFALHIQKDKKMNIEFCGDKAGATLYPLEIYSDHKGKLAPLYEQKAIDINPEKRSIHSFINKCLGEHDEWVANGEEGYKIQKLVESLYRSAEIGESVYL